MNKFLKGGSFLIIEDYADNSKKDSLNYFHDEIHGLPEGVDACSFEDGPKLGAPPSFYFILNYNLGIKIGFGPALDIQFVVVEAGNQFLYNLIELFLDALIGKINLLLYFLQHQPLLVHQLHVVIGGICMDGYGETYCVEISH